MRSLLPSSLLLALFILVPASAEHCFGYAPEATGFWQITDGSAEGTLYVDDHGYVSGDGIWLWQEANGIWTPKLPGVYPMPPWWVQDDLQLGGCALMDIAMCDGWDYPWGDGGCVRTEYWPDFLLY